MLTNINSFVVLKVFFDSPEKKFHIREISRMTRLSPPGVIKIVKKLVSEGILISEKNKVVKNILPARSEKFVQLKRIFNVYSLYEQGVVSSLRQKYEEPEAIVLFGSYSRGEDISSSDIDLAVITKKHINIDLKKFEAVLKRKIDIHEIKIKSAEKEFLNSLSNGIVLYGYLKVL